MRTRRSTIARPSLHAAGPALATAAALARACAPSREPLPRGRAAVTALARDAASASSVRSIPPAPAEGCPALDARADALPGTVHAPSVAQNETWTAAGSPHRLPDGVAIGPNASVTLTPCALVLTAAGRGVRVGAGGALFAVGERGRPVRFDGAAAAPAQGAWVGVRIEPQARGSSRLAHVVVARGGGAPLAPSPDPPACVVVAADRIDLRHVATRDCGGRGVLVRHGVALAETSLGVAFEREAPPVDP